MWGGGGGRKREREREVLAVEVLIHRQRGDGAVNYWLLCGGSSRHPPAVESRALYSPYNVCGMDGTLWLVKICWILLNPAMRWSFSFFIEKKMCWQPLKVYSVCHLLLIYPNYCRSAFDSTVHIWYFKAWQECNRPPESSLLSLMSSSWAGMASWPPCHIMNSTSDAIWVRWST